MTKKSKSRSGKPAVHVPGGDGDEHYPPTPPKEEQQDVPAGDSVAAVVSSEPLPDGDRTPDQAQRTIDDVLSGAVPVEDPPQTSLLPAGDTSAPVKAKRGRKPGSSNKEYRSRTELLEQVERLEAREAAARAAMTTEQVRAQIVEPLAESFDAVFNGIGRWRGEHWKIDKNDKIKLGEVWAPIVGPLLVDRPETLLWVAAIGGTWNIVAPRLDADRRIAEARAGSGGGE